MKLNRKLALGLAVGAIAALSIAGAAFAHPGGPTKGSKDTYLDKLAQALGIQRSALDAAVATAQAQVVQEQLATYLASAVTNGLITQAQSDEINAWLGSRPAATDKVLGLGAGIGHFQLQLPLSGANLTTRLANLVTNGTLTQAESDSITAWVGARPVATDSLMPAKGSGPGREFGPGRGGRGGHGGRGHRGGHGFGDGMFKMPAPQQPATPQNPTPSQQSSFSQTRA